MDSAGDKLLACSGLTGNENRRIGWRNLGDAREHRLQSGRGSNDLLEHRGPVDLFAESDVFFFQPLLGSLAVVYIGIRNIPASDVAIVVSYRIEASQKPTITSIVLAQTQLQLIGRSC